MAMPTRYREEIAKDCEGRLVITIDQDECLIIYPQPKWLEIENKLETAVGNDEALVAFRRLYVGNATECEMDGQGRISLPQYLRDWAKLDKRVVLVGLLYKFELWNEDDWVANNKRTIEAKKEGRLKLPQEIDVAI